MGRKDSVMNDYLAEPGRFADLVNHGLFGGRKIIRPEKLQGFDRLSHEKGETLSIRDVVKSYHNGAAKLVVIGVENQEKIHYAMPLRVASYDIRAYEKERIAISKEHRKVKDLEGAEWLSQFGKSDKLTPVITLVVYYGSEPWDGPRSLLEMLRVPEELEPFRELIGNYEIHLLEVQEIQDLDSYGDELKMMFGFVKYQKDGEALDRFLAENEELFRAVPRETCEAIAVMTHLDEIEQYMEKDEEVVDMCEGWEQIKRKERMEGELEGRQQGELEGELKGIEKGQLSKLIELIIKKQIKNQEYTVIADALEEKPSYIKRLCEIINEYAPEYDIAEILKGVQAAKVK